MRKSLLFLICIILLSTSCSRIENAEKRKEEKKHKNEISIGNKGNLANAGLIGDDITITRGEASRIIALSFMTQGEIQDLQRVNNFKDIDNSEYENYINACVKLGYISDGEYFRPYDNLTINEAQIIANNMSKNSVVLQFDKDAKKNPISYALFVKTITTVLEHEGYLDNIDVSYKNYIILATKENNDKLGNNVITDYGVVKTSYINYADELNSQVKTLSRDNEIICAIATIDTTPILEDVYILKSENDILTIFIGGLTRQYIYNKKFNKDLKGNLCDVQIEGDKVIKLDLHTDYIKQEIKLIDIENKNKKFVEVINDVEIEFENYNQLKVYRDYGEKVRWGEFSDIVIGDENTKLFVNDENEIIGCVVSERPQAEKIRVLLNTSNFSSRFHNEVSITSDKEFYVKNGKYNKTINAGEVYTVPDDTPNRVIITPSEDAELELVGVKRQNKVARYEGEFEVKKFNTGFVVVNVINIEDYLQRVVPSEMPSTYHKEALKAQAVTARSFAMKTLYQTSYKRYGANLDDSTSSQVYNNIDEIELVNEAIKETEGVVITYDNKPVSTNFYSTSSGFGASSGDVWADFKNKAFPTNTPEYLSSKPLISKSSMPSSNSEEEVRKFLKSTDIKAVDSNYGWFRWNYEMSAKEIENSINKNIQNRYNVNPFMILTKVGDSFVDKKIESVDNIKDIKIVSRGDGGIITAIEIVSDNKTIKIMGEYNIRYILKPVQYGKGNGIVINKHDGTTTENYSLVPSAFFAIDKHFDSNGDLVKIEFFGGGNGHGVGMSQNGAQELAKNNVTYDKILKYFYNGIEIVKY